MEVACPNCSRRFHLPDTVKPGSKLRCSVCKQVFRLEVPATPPQAQPAPQSAPSAAAPQPAPAAADPQSAPAAADPQSAPAAAAPQPASAVQEERMDMDFNLEMPPKKKGGFKKFLLFVLVLILLGGAGAGGWWWYTNKMYPPVPVPGEQARKVAKLTLSDVRQYYVDNDKVGKIFVIEGKVINGFDRPKDLIELEASMYGKDKKPLQSKRVLAGISLSFFQLKVMAEKELETLLGNKIEILSNNTNVASGASVPFMVLFYAPAGEVAEFGVRIVDVQESEASEAAEAPASAADAKPAEASAAAGDAAPAAAQSQGVPAQPAQAVQPSAAQGQPASPQGAQSAPAGHKDQAPAAQTAPAGKPTQAVPPSAAPAGPQGGSAPAGKP